MVISKYDLAHIYRFADMSVIYFQNKYYPKAKCGLDFKEEFSFPHKEGVAFQGEEAFFASSLNEGGHPYFSIINTSFTLKNWVAKSFGDNYPVESAYIPGTYYKRIWRPFVTNGSFHKAISQEKLNQSFVSLKILLNKLEELFETIEPTSQNLQAYGHKIREVILLACMEVESSWTAILKENGYCSHGEYLTTKDYVKLVHPMFLDGYKLYLQQYPNLLPFSPFGAWDAIDPTKTLPWYDAYNKTKHDRESNLNLATLNNAVNSVGAAVIMFHAQFGFHFDPSWQPQREWLIRSIFRITTEVFKKYNKEFYIPKIDLVANPHGEKYSNISWEWKAINFPF